MVFPAQASRSAVLGERLLITKLITSACLALLLVLGLAATSHIEMGGSIGSPMATDVVGSDSRSNGAVVAQRAATDDLGGVSSQAVVSFQSDALLGAAMCALGILCSLAFIVLLRRLWRRTRPSPLGIMPRVISEVFPSSARMYPRSLLLTQLGLSRT